MSATPHWADAGRSGRSWLPPPRSFEIEAQRRPWCPGLLANVDCDGLLYWDGFHPTKAAHALIAEEVLRLTSEPAPAPVPLPASGPVLLAALGAFAVLRRRVGPGAA